MDTSDGVITDNMDVDVPATPPQMVCLWIESFPQATVVSCCSVPAASWCFDFGCGWREGIQASGKSECPCLLAVHPTHLSRRISRQERMTTVLFQLWTTPLPPLKYAAMPFVLGQY